MAFFDHETDLDDTEGKIQRRAYGMIVVDEGEFWEIKFKPWPKIISTLEIGLFGERQHRQSASADRCLLYYNQPLFHRKFLALKYIVSHQGTQFRSFRLATRVLDHIARIKRTDAIVCEVNNFRISNRLMKRWGWVAHCQERPNRNFIKRFYGEYPASLVEETDPVVQADERGNS